MQEIMIELVARKMQLDKRQVENTIKLIDDLAILVVSSVNVLGFKAKKRLLNH